MEEIKKGKQNNIERQVALIANTEYTCPSDGYFLVSSSATRGVISEGYVNGIALLRVSAPTDINLAGHINNSIYVRAGMKIRFTGTAGYFYPIV